MGMVTARVTDSGIEQAEVTIREAAELAGVSQKTVRKLLKEGKVRGRMGESRYGRTWFVDLATLPLRADTLEAGRVGLREGGTGEGEGHGAELYQGQDRVGTGLISMLADLQRRHEGALVRLGQLESADQERKMLAERTESLIVPEAEARQGAERLGEEMDQE
jgi:excisionase family DNA binding protein